MDILKPTNFDPNHYFNRYISSAPNTDLIESLEETTKAMTDYMSTLDTNDGSYAYEEGKWTIKQVLQHINDTERIMAYRAFRISRKDSTNMPGFEQDDYADNDYSKTLSIEAIKAEFIAIRQSTKLLFTKMNAEVIDFKERASNFDISPRAIGWVISGHAAHHLNVLKNRYQH